MKVASVGPPAGELKPFDEHGRRNYPMRTAGGVQNVVQVITEITPQYVRVQALAPYTWDSRVSTNTIDDATLEKFLMHQISPKNVKHRKKIVRFFLQCKRYGKAVEVLQELLDEKIANTTETQDLLQIKDQLAKMYASRCSRRLAAADERPARTGAKLSQGFPYRRRDGRNPADRSPGPAGVCGLQSAAGRDREGVDKLELRVANRANRGSWRRRCR